MSNRTLRINELVQREISAYLHTRYQSEAVRITITSVRVSPDLHEGRVFYSVLGGKPARSHILALAALRYVLLGTMLYVIFMFSRVGLMAALVGLFVSTTAVLAEGVFELLHGKRNLDHPDIQ